MCYDIPEPKTKMIESCDCCPLTILLAPVHMPDKSQIEIIVWWSPCCRWLEFRVKVTYSCFKHRWSEWKVQFGHSYSTLLYFTVSVREHEWSALQWSYSSTHSFLFFLVFPNCEQRKSSTLSSCSTLPALPSIKPPLFIMNGKVR